MRWWLALPVLVLLLASAYLFVGYSHVARFPYDWQYYREVNVGGKVAVVTLPTAQLVREGKLRPDCSDLRFTTDDNVPVELNFAIPRYYWGGAVSARDGGRCTYYDEGNFFMDINYGYYKLCFRFPSRYRDYASFWVWLYDSNDNLLWHHEYGCNYCYGTTFCSSTVGPGHYVVRWRTHDEDCKPPAVEAETDLPGVHVYGRVPTLVTLSYNNRRVYYGVRLVPDYNVANTFCADMPELNFYVRIPDGVSRIRVWYGAVGDVNTHLKLGLEHVSDVVSLPLSLSKADFYNSNCTNERYGCGGDMYCSRSYRRSYGPFSIDMYYSGVGHYASYGRINCHGKRFVDNYYGYCGDVFGGSYLARNYGWKCGGCYPDDYPSTQGRAVIHVPSDWYFYMFYLGSTTLRGFGDDYGSWGDYYGRVQVLGTVFRSCVDCTATLRADMHPYCREDLGCFVEYDSGFETFLNKALLYMHRSAFSRNAVFAAWRSGSWASCFTAGIYPGRNPIPVYYIRESDLSLASVGDERVFSAEPYWVFNGPLRVYWGQEVTYSVEGNFVRAEFEVEPFGTFEGNSVTVEWNTPGVYRVTPVVYNEYNTPFWKDFDVNVVRREVNLSFSYQSAYVAEPFEVTFTVRDVLGDLVDANVYVSGCAPCYAVGGQCTTTCEYNEYGVVPVEVNVRVDDRFYVPLSTGLTFDVNRWETELRDFSAEKRDEYVVFSGRLWDAHHGEPVVGVPVLVSVYGGSCDGNALATKVLYTLPDGSFRFYVDASPGRYCVSAKYDGDCYHAPAYGEGYVEFAPPSGGGEVTGENVVYVDQFTGTGSVPVVASVPVNVSVSGGGMSVSGYIVYAVPVALVALAVLVYFLM